MTFFIETYGSYTDLVYAIGVVSRIMQSNEFTKFLTLTFFMASLIGLGYSVFSSFYRGAKISYNWGFNLFLGMLFVFFAIKPTATVVIEDKYYGKSGTAGYFQTIKNVPFGAAVMVWFYSYTQNILTDMIDTYGSPVVAFEDGGMDVSYKLITGMDGILKSVQNVDQDLLLNLQHYVHDCVMPGVAQGLIDISDLTTPRADGLWTKMKLTNAGDIYTTLYSGSMQSCNAVHTGIAADFDGKLEAILNDYCSQNGIAGSACQSKISAITNGFFDKNARDYVLTYLSAATTKSVAESYLELADKQTNVSNATAAIQAEKWLPKLRANTFVVIVLLAPLAFLLVFFAPGPMLKWYFGMYVWLILWGGVDQLMFVMYQMELYEVFQSMRSSGIGFLQVLDVKHEMLETMGLYGRMRWMSMTLSLAMCMGILKLGNHAMVSLAGDMGAAAQQTAGASAQGLSGVGGTDAARDSYEREKARGWAASVTPSEAIGNQVVMDYSQGIAGALAKQSMLGMNSYESGKTYGENQTYQEYKGLVANQTEIELTGSGDMKTAADIVGTGHGYEGYKSSVGSHKEIETVGGGDMKTSADAVTTERIYQEQKGIAAGQTERELIGEDLKESAQYMGTMAGAENVAQTMRTEGKIESSGGMPQYLSESRQLEQFNFNSSMGNMEGAQKRAEFMGNTDREQAFMEKAGGALSNEQAQRLNNDYGFNVKAGDVMNYSVDADGKFSNVTVSSHTSEGTMQAVYDNKGNLAFSTASGVSQDGYKYDNVYDRDGNLILSRGQKGDSADTYVGAKNIQMGATAQYGNVLIESALKGDTKPELAHVMFGENRDPALVQTSLNAQSDAMAHYMSSSRQAGATLNTEVGAKIFGSGGGFSANASDTEVMNTLRQHRDMKYNEIQKEDIPQEQKVQQWDEYNQDLMNLYEHKSEQMKAGLIANNIKENGENAATTINDGVNSWYDANSNRVQEDKERNLGNNDY